MLKDQWVIVEIMPIGNTNRYIFATKEDASIQILLFAPTESEAWEKLGILLGKDDKGNVKTEVFEGVVNVYDYYDMNFPNIIHEEGGSVLESLMQYEGKRVEVTVKIKE